MGRIAAAPFRPVLVFWRLLMPLILLSAYAFAIALAAFCLFLAWAAFRTLGSMGSMALLAVFLAIAAAVCGVAVLWSLIPRRTPAPALGARLDAAAHPRLFDEIRAIAAEFREPVPADVYYTLLPTLGVGQQGKTRSLQIGLPFLAVLRVTEFRAALAHEFAHFYGGDTGVGPRILKTHATLDRALRSFSSREGMMGFLARHPYSKPVHNAVLRVLASYWRLYLRLVLLIQRQWEFRADELACAVAGGEGVVSGLPKLAVATIGWAGYGINAAGPMLQLGCLPPIAEGFRRYLKDSPAAPAIAGAAAKLLAEEKPHPFATHPTVAQRVARAGRRRFPAPPPDDSPAVSLLGDVTEAERLAVASAIPGIAAASLQPIAWEEAAGRYARMWREFAEQHRELLAGYRIADLPRAAGDLPALAPRMPDPPGRLFSPEQRVERCATLLWVACAAALLDAGWEARLVPGDVVLARDAVTVYPHEWVAGLCSGQMSAAEFEKLSADLGIAALPLSAAEAPARLAN